MINVQPVIENGIAWHQFHIRFEGADGIFEVPIYAVSFEHAFHLLEDLKATGRIEGKVLAREI